MLECALNVYQRDWKSKSIKEKWLQILFTKMIKKNPLVSIIITYFRKKKYVSKTLFSILNQTYKNYEIIFVYDDNNKEDLKLIKKLLIKFKKKKNNYK